MEVTYFVLAGWNRCFRTRLGIQVMLHPLRATPSRTLGSRCARAAGDFARRPVIGSERHGYKSCTRKL